MGRQRLGWSYPRELAWGSKQTRPWGSQASPAKTARVLSPSSLARPSHREPMYDTRQRPKGKRILFNSRGGTEKISRSQQPCTTFDKSHTLYINYKPMKFKKPREEQEANCRGTSKSNCHIPVSTWLAFQIKLKCWWGCEAAETLPYTLVGMQNGSVKHLTVSDKVYTYRKTRQLYFYVFIQD